MNALLRLGPSRLATYEACPRMFYYKYILKWKAHGTPANLVYGHTVHAAIELFLRARHQRLAFDPAAKFLESWDDTTSKVEVSYGSNWTPDEMRALGKKLLGAFANRWMREGLVPITDEKGEPVVERLIDLDIGDKIIISTKIDVVVMTPEANVRVLDFKNPAQPSPDGFALVADQTLAGQLAVDSIADALGIDQVDEVGYVELVKQKTKSLVLFEEVAPRRPSDQVEEFLGKVRDTANLIRKGKFPRRAGYAFNSPCSGCDYRNHCLHGCIDDLDPASLTTPFPSKPLTGKSISAQLLTAA